MTYSLRDQPPQSTDVVLFVHTSGERGAVCSGAVMLRYSALYGPGEARWTHATEEERANHVRDQERIDREYGTRG